MTGTPLPSLEVGSPGGFWSRLFGTSAAGEARGALFQTEFTLEQVVSVVDRFIRLEELEETATSRAVKAHLVRLLQEMGVPDPRAEALIIRRQGVNSFRSNQEP